MRLDRRATVRLYTGHRNAKGRWVRELAASHGVWLGLESRKTPRILESEGVRTEPVAEFRVRWFAALANADLAMSHEVVMNGQTWLIVERAEVVGDDERGPAVRRRWLSLTCVERS